MQENFLKLYTAKGQLVNELITSAPLLMQHTANKNHQYQHLDSLKNNLQKDEVVLHLDFSENYVCKYQNEVQSFHFEGSKEQVVLHTVMVYINTGDKSFKQAFRTFSKLQRKDPVAIIAHLKPVIQYILSQCSPERIHFISDDSSTQYTNFKMFHLFGTYFPREIPTIKFMSWNYSERGHGKGAPDGIGGCIRVADRLVALG